LMDENWLVEQLAVEWVGEQVQASELEEEQQV
jgi:hypothetical protein